MVDKKETTKTPKTWLDEHDLDEIINTTHMEIIDTYNIIEKDDLLHSRKVIIETLPEIKVVEKGEHQGLELTTMNITDQGKLYQLLLNAKSTQRSIIRMAILESEKQLNRKIKDKSEIDMSLIIGKLYLLKRERVKVKGYPEQRPLIFSEIKK